MSGKIEMEFQISNLEILENTLRRLNLAYDKKENKIVLARDYNSIIISNNNISCDTADVSEIELIKSEYQRDFQIFERNVRGEVYEVVDTKDEIIITVQ